MNAATRLLSSLVDAVRRPVLRRRLDRVVVETVRGVPLVVLPEVFNPVVFRTGRFLAEALEDGVVTRPPSPSGEAPRALDLGTGSGVGAVFAARAGYAVTAVDLNPEAVRCARVNALLNGLEDRIEVLQGDLFAPVAGRRFDLVLFNPPFFRGDPVRLRDAAWRSRDVPERFAAALPGHLAPGGRALVLLSSHGDGASLLAGLAARGLELSVAASRDFGGEVLRLHSVRSPASAARAAAPAPGGLREVAAR
ncbi:MAG TPA: methyltransferase [Thermoanaerobaculia bacterium]